jgi:hypothetical protein
MQCFSTTLPTDDVVTITSVTDDALVLGTTPAAGDAEAITPATDDAVITAPAPELCSLHPPRLPRETPVRGHALFLERWVCIAVKQESKFTFLLLFLFWFVYQRFPVIPRVYSSGRIAAGVYEVLAIC